MKFSVRYHTQWGESLVLKIGHRTFDMNYGDGDVWSVNIPAPKVEVRTAYHYEVVRDGRILRTEEAWHSLCPGDKGPRKDAWLESPRSQGAFRAAGVAVPVFSLRSENGFGIGEFADLKLLVDWAAGCGMEIIQLLPVGDTTATGTYLDSYPYNPISNFALHPLYLNLPAAGVEEDDTYRQQQRELNMLPQVDYERVHALKHGYLRKAYRDNWPQIRNSASFESFYKENKSWLLPYAVFSAIRDEKGTPDFSQWGTLAEYSPKKASEYHKTHILEVEYWFFLQYHLDAQFSEIVRYAHSKGVMLKGDIPIGVNRCSVDCWTDRELFNMDSQAGAPPDFFSRDGQNWGFPTYNWEAMARDGYKWWRGRLKNMSKYFDAYRMDHILGFFRIWEIPVPELSGRSGHFNPSMPYSADELVSWGFDPLDETRFIEDPRRRGYYHPRIDAPQGGAFGGLYEDFFFHRHNGFWARTAMKKLPALLGATDMLPCAEDLGMLADCVPAVMSELNILSLELQLMPKRFGERFADPRNFPYRSVCTTSTHDMSPLREWWTSDRHRAQDWYNSVLGRSGDAPLAPEGWIFREIVRMHIDSTSMLAIIPIQDYLAMDDEMCAAVTVPMRINDPANPHHYWRYRIHLTLEQLLAAGEFNSSLAELVRTYR